jgi:hypothetical protein
MLLVLARTSSKKSKVCSVKPRLVFVVNAWLVYEDSLEAT